LEGIRGGERVRQYSLSLHFRSKPDVRGSSRGGQVEQNYLGVRFETGTIKQGPRGEGISAINGKKII